MLSLVPAVETLPSVGILEISLVVLGMVVGLVDLPLVVDSSTDVVATLSVV